MVRQGNAVIFSEKIYQIILPLVLLILLLLTACAPNLLIETPTPAIQAIEIAATPPTSEYTFSGSVTRGQTFMHNFAPTLTFQLLPYQEGWEIWLGDPTHSLDEEDNFAMPVTFPFASINVRHIEGWHFRNLDNSGPNETGDKNVNAPQEVRNFCFVTTHNDFQRALDSLVAGIPALSETLTSGEIPISRGTLTITDYTLGNLIPEQKANFETIVFTVTLHLDRPCDTL